jgi:hypothetical protein
MLIQNQMLTRFTLQIIIITMNLFLSFITKNRSQRARGSNHEIKIEK